MLCQLLTLQCCISDLDTVEVSELSESQRDHILYQTVSPIRCHSESSQIGMPSIQIVRPPYVDCVRLYVHQTPPPALEGAATVLQWSVPRRFKGV